MRPISFAATALLSLALAACQQGEGSAPVQSAPAQSASPPGETSSADLAASGHALAQAVCSVCHAVERSQLSPNPKSPPFEDIANQRGLTAGTLAEWLRSAHNYPADMNFALAPTKADDLAAYIVTLQAPDYKPPIQ